MQGEKDVKLDFPGNKTAILYMDGHCGSYVNTYKSEIFLMPNKTFVDIFISTCILQEIVLCRCFKIFFLIKSQPSWN